MTWISSFLPFRFELWQNKETEEHAKPFHKVLVFCVKNLKWCKRKFNLQLFEQNITWLFDCDHFFFSYLGAISSSLFSKLLDVVLFPVGSCSSSSWDWPYVVILDYQSERLVCKPLFSKVCYILWNKNNKWSNFGSCVNIIIFLKNCLPFETLKNVD